MTHGIRIKKTGGPEVLEYERVDVAAPGPGHVLLRQTAIGVNYIDTYHRSGLYPLPSLPHGIGAEAAGVVEAVGDGVTSVAPGDRVAYAGGAPGAYATGRIVPAQILVKLPGAIDDRTAAAMMLKGMTVEYLIRRTFKVEKGMHVLWHAAAGGVGLIACQWLASLGAHVIGTVSTPEKAALAKQHGCEHTIQRGEDIASRVRELTGGNGVPVVYDSVGRETMAASLDSLARRGMLVSFGNASGKPEPLDPLVLSHKGSLYLTRPTLKDYTATRDELEASAGALFAAVATGAVKIHVAQTFPLRQAADAHRALESRSTVGSTVLLPD
ncbi:MAG: quinone oxidoreductase [Acidobacteriota bacterium]